MDDPETKVPLSHRERDRERGSIDLTARARTLRRQARGAKSVLWKHLRARRLQGYKFRRQVVIDPYVVDFACLEVKLIIAADGDEHGEQVVYDAGRTADLEVGGIVSCVSGTTKFWVNF